MADYSEEEEGSYESSPYDSEQEESNQGWSDEESGYETPPWPHEDYSGSYYGDEPNEYKPEPEPPDYSRDDSSHQSWSEKETDSRNGDTDSQISHGNDSWPEEE